MLIVVSLRVIAEMATGKRKAYDPAFKVRVVELAEANTQAAAARKFGVAEKQVREWKKKKEALLAARGGPGGREAVAWS